MRDVPRPVTDQLPQHFEKFFRCRGDIPADPHGKDDILRGVDVIQFVIVEMVFETAVENEGIRDDRDRDSFIGPAERRFDIVYRGYVLRSKTGFPINVGMALIKAAAGFYTDETDVFTSVEGDGSRLKKRRRFISDVFCCDRVASQRFADRMISRNS